MIQEKKTRRILIVLVIVGLVLLITIVGILFGLGLLENNDPIYGEFTCMNDDGTEAKVTLSESSVYFENLDYKAMEEVQATFAATRERNQENRECTDDEFEELRQKYLDCMDFLSYYDKKEHLFDEMQYIEEERQYYYYVNYPDVDGCCIDICIDLGEKILEVGGMEFQYIE